MITSIVDEQTGDIQPVHQKGFLLNMAKYFLPANNKVSPDNFLECLELLKENGHIELFINDDIYRITYRATRKGDYHLLDKIQ